MISASLIVVVVIVAIIVVSETFTPFKKDRVNFIVCEASMVNLGVIVLIRCFPYESKSSDEIRMIGDCVNR